MSEEIVPRGHRELTEEEAREHVDRAFVIERAIKSDIAATAAAGWTLAEHLYEFHEGGYWSACGYETLNEFLAQPEIGLTRSTFFRATKAWRDLVIVRKVASTRLHQIEPSKVYEVVPAIMRGDVSVDDALDDAEGLGQRDLREKYRSAKVDDSKPLAAEDEPVRVQCEACGSWYIPATAERPE